MHGQGIACDESDSLSSLGHPSLLVVIVARQIVNFPYAVYTQSMPEQMR